MWRLKAEKSCAVGNTFGLYVTVPLPVPVYVVATGHVGEVCICIFLLLLCLPLSSLTSLHLNNLSATEAINNKTTLF